MAGSTIRQIKDVLLFMFFLHFLRLVLVAPVAGVLIQRIGMAGCAVALGVAMPRGEAMAAVVIGGLPAIDGVTLRAIGAESTTMCVVTAVA